MKMISVCTDTSPILCSMFHGFSTDIFAHTWDIENTGNNISTMQSLFKYTDDVRLTNTVRRSFHADIRERGNDLAIRPVY